jgi:hypothetical protein
MRRKPGRVILEAKREQTEGNPILVSSSAFSGNVSKSSSNLAYFVTTDTSQLRSEFTFAAERVMFQVGAMRFFGVIEGMRFLGDAPDEELVLDSCF